MASEAEWSRLPRDILDLISKQLPSEIDILRFRSVCSPWRSSIPRPFPSRFPIIPNQGISDSPGGFHLLKRTIYHLRPKSSELKNSSWIIKLEQDDPNRAHLLSPLSMARFNPLPPSFPRIFDFRQFPVLELGHEYILRFVYSPFVGAVGNMYKKKVALSLEKDGIFMLLTIHESGKLVMYKSCDEKWTLIDDFPSTYDDVICKDGSFYAVDDTGRTVTVNCGSGPSVSVVAGPVAGGDKKFLVESSGNLLLVDRYLSDGPEDDWYMSRRTVKFKVFELDREEGRWVEMGSLGDRVVFLGDNCTFSGSALEIASKCKGNCVFFTDRSWGLSWVRECRGIGVFDLGTRSIGPICDYPGYSDLFWPPRHWVYPYANIEDGWVASLSSD